MLTSGAKVLAGGAIAGITAVTYYIVTRSRSKATRDAQAPGAPPAKAARLLPEEASPRVDEFGLLGQLVDLDEFYELVRHCSAIDAVRLSRCSVALHERLADPSTAAWCAESRRALLSHKQRCKIYELSLGANMLGHREHARGVHPLGAGIPVPQDHAP